LPTVRWYAVHGVGVEVATNVAAVLDLADATYGALEAPPDAAALRIEVLDTGDGYRIVAPYGGTRATDDLPSAMIALLNAFATIVTRGLDERGLVAVHAGAVVERGHAVVVAGPSGRGKTTLTLALVERGLDFLSDELAILDPATGRVLPYRRSLHVRPETCALLPGLDVFCDQPSRDLGDGNEWVVSPAALTQTFPGGLAQDVPLGSVLLLAERPREPEPVALEEVPRAVAAMELLRGTPAAAFDFARSLQGVAAALGVARCARLRAGALDETVDAVLAWLEREGR